MAGNEKAVAEGETASKAAVKKIVEAPFEAECVSVGSGKVAETKSVEGASEGPLAVAAPAVPAVQCNAAAAEVQCNAAAAEVQCNAVAAPAVATAAPAVQCKAKSQVAKDNAAATAGIVTEESGQDGDNNAPSAPGKRKRSHKTTQVHVLPASNWLNLPQVTMFKNPKLSTAFREGRMRTEQANMPLADFTQAF